jgi:hypothetical protein
MVEAFPYVWTVPPKKKTCGATILLWRKGGEKVQAVVSILPEFFYTNFWRCVFAVQLMEANKFLQFLFAVWSQWPQWSFINHN